MLIFCAISVKTGFSALNPEFPCLVGLLLQVNLSDNYRTKICADGHIW
jgi:hypothetical protein